MAISGYQWFWDPRILGSQVDPRILGSQDSGIPRILASKTHDPSETHLRRLKMKNVFFKKKLPNSFEKVEITKESHRCSALCDTCFRKTRNWRIRIGQFFTEHFGLRGRIRSTFSKIVWNFGTRFFKKMYEKYGNCSELDLRPPFWAFLNAKLIAEGPGTSWNHSRPLKRP